MYFASILIAQFEFDCILLKPGLLQPGLHVAGLNELWWLVGTPSDPGPTTQRRNRSYPVSVEPICLDSLRGSSVKIGTTQRRLAWPLRARL